MRTANVKLLKLHINALKYPIDITFPVKFSDKHCFFTLAEKRYTCIEPVPLIAMQTTSKRSRIIAC